jgi:hypothetical protein
MTLLRAKSFQEWIKSVKKTYIIGGHGPSIKPSSVIIAEKSLKILAEFPETEKSAEKALEIQILADFFPQEINKFLASSDILNILPLNAI